MERRSLPRQLSLFQVVTYGIGNIVGAGIYVLVGDAAGLAGTSLWVSFLVAAVVATFTFPKLKNLCLNGFLSLHKRLARTLNEIVHK
ncbi:MAG: hypothetical protein QXG05_03920 [Nitrososphaerota archaeon]